MSHFLIKIKLEVSAIKKVLLNNDWNTEGENTFIEYLESNEKEDTIPEKNKAVLQGGLIVLNALFIEKESWNTYDLSIQFDKLEKEDKAAPIRKKEKSELTAVKNRADRWMWPDLKNKLQQSGGAD